MLDMVSIVLKFENHVDNQHSAFDSASSDLSAVCFFKEPVASCMRILYLTVVQFRLTIKKYMLEKIPALRSKKSWNCMSSD
jgi:hypothetical protein